jgi:hypothetical protein
MTNDEIQHEQAVTEFFEQAVKDGKMTREELEELTGNERRGHGLRSSHSRTLKVFEDFVISACHEADRNADDVTEFKRAAMRVRIDVRLAELGLTRRHVELYMNYPEWTETELGVAFGMPRRTVAYQLDRVRKSWPSFRLGAPMQQRDECPALEHMDRIECSDTNPWLDENAIRRRF